jgi:hypothetical protein
MKYSKNKLAEEIVGLRDIPENAIPFDQPCELGYHCPVCKYDHISKEGNFDERLLWSEYNAFIWCRVCNRDYPSCLCIPLDKPLPYFLKTDPVTRAIETYLRGVEDAIERAGEKK